MCQRRKKSGEIEKMYSPDAVADEMRQAVIAAGGNRQWSDTRDAWLSRAANVLGIGQPRAKSLFYRKARLVPAYEADMIRDRIKHLQAQQDRQRERINAVASRLGAAVHEAKQARTHTIGMADGEGRAVGSLAPLDTPLKAANDV